MVFGNLNDVLEGDKSIYQQISENLDINKIKKPSKISDILHTLSHYGMSYSGDVYKNMIAIPAQKGLSTDINVTMGNIYNIPDTYYKQKTEEEKPFSEKTFDQKRQILRKLSVQPEIEEILDILSNECIVYDSDLSYICQPFIDTAVVQMFNEEFADKIRNAMDSIFYKLYMLLNWKVDAWNIYKRYLIDGKLAYEIVYDDLENPKSITTIVELDPLTLTKKVENGELVWYQFAGVQNMERRLLDSQIIYIQYEDSNNERSSYVERLIRPFNMFRIVEQAQIIWTVTQSSFKTMFTIPVGGMGRAKGAQTLNSAMNRYKEDISFNTETGDLKVNGKTNLPFNKEYWMPETAEGKPEIETITDNGPALADNEQLKFFLGRLYKISKIPENRFDKEANSTWFGSDPTQQLRDEINFSRFVDRLRNNFSEILLKPLKIQLAIQVPELKNDKRVLDAISLRFNAYNQFEEMMNMEIDSKRIEFISNMSQSLVTTDKDGQERPYFAMKFLIMKYLKMSDADLELNEKYKFEEQINAGNAEEDNEEENMADNEMNSPGSEEENEPSNHEDNGKDEENNDFDKEIMGDVQPESPETTQA